MTNPQKKKKHTRSGLLSKITYFNYDKCEAVSSRDMRMEDIKISVRTAFNSDIDNKVWYIRDSEFVEIDIISLMKDVDSSMKRK